MPWGLAAHVCSYVFKEQDPRGLAFAHLPCGNGCSGSQRAIDALPIEGPAASMKLCVFI